MLDEWASALGKVFALTVVTIAGILMRHAHAASLSGQMQWKMFGVACLTSPALGVIAGGAAEWAGATGAVLWAIVALTGFLGPAIIHATTLTILGRVLPRKEP